jgi:hypothetical protein
MFASALSRVGALLGLGEGPRAYLLPSAGGGVLPSDTQIFSATPRLWHGLSGASAGAPQGVFM